MIPAITKFTSTFVNVEISNEKSVSLKIFKLFMYLTRSRNIKHGCGNLSFILNSSYSIDFHFNNIGNLRILISYEIIDVLPRM